jgi:hypothetical protein
MLETWVGRYKFRADITEDVTAPWPSRVRYTVDDKEVAREDFTALYAFARAVYMCE